MENLREGSMIDINKLRGLLDSDPANADKTDDDVLSITCSTSAGQTLEGQVLMLFAST